MDSHLQAQLFAIALSPGLPMGDAPPNRVSDPGSHLVFRDNAIFPKILYNRFYERLEMGT